jgi:hypothetical protein
MKVYQMLDTTTASDFESDPGTNSEPPTKDQIAAERQRDDCKAQPVTRDGATVLCASQDRIDIAFSDEGDAIITQSRWPDEDQTILISRVNIPEFIDRLTDALGIPAFGGPAR